MKGPPPSPPPPPPPRPKKPLSAAQKLKFLCSFGGVFAPRHSSGELRYVGGDTRIISLDRRGINLLNLLSRVSELRPGRLFSLKYQFPGAASSPGPQLIAVATDDDVQRMIESYDRLAAHGKASRIRVFLCDAPMLSHGYVEPANPIPGVRFGSHAGDSIGQDKVLGRDLALQNVNGRTHVSDIRNSSDSSHRKVFGTQITNSHVNVIHYGCDPYEGSVNPGGVNGSSGGSLCGVGFDRPSFDAFHTDQVICCSTTAPGMRTADHAIVGNINIGNYIPEDINQRENVIPCNTNHATIKGCFALVSANNQSNRRALPMKIVGGSCRPSCNPQLRTRSHQLGGTDFHGHGIVPNDVQAYWGILNDTGVRKVCGEGFCVPKCYPGLMSRSNKLGLPKAHQTHLPKPVDDGNNAKALREQAWESNQVTSVTNHPTGHGSLPDLLFRDQQSDGISACHPNPTKLSDNLVPHSSTSTIADNCLCCSIPGKAATESDTTYINNPFVDNIDLVVDRGSSICHTNNDYNSDKASSLELVKLDKVEAMLSTLYPSCDRPLIDLGENDTILMGNSNCLQSDHSQFVGICEAVGTLRGDSPNVGSCVMKTPLDLSMHNLSLCPSTEACFTMLFPSPSSSNVSEASTCISNGIAEHPKHEAEVQRNKEDVMINNPFITGPVIRNMPREMANDHLNVQSSMSIKDAAESKFLQKSSQAPESSVSGVSPCCGEELAYCGKNQEASVSMIVEEKASMVGSRNINSEENGEASSNVSGVYSHLTTQKLQTIKNSDLEEVWELGSGTYGTVFYGKWRGSDVAIKRLKPSCFTGGDLEEDRLVADFWKEAHLLSQLHHPNVVAFYGVVTDGAVSNLATVTEYMVNGSLKKILQRKDRTIDRRKRLIIAMDAAFGMEYLHEKNIVHFDLKSHNFLVNMRDPHRPVCKIGDLGLSKVKQKTLVSGGVRGTIPWMAPELLTSTGNMVTEKVDVYSFGIVMWELLTGEEPYEIMRSEEIITGIIKGDLRPEIPSWCDPAWRSLMERCWLSDPSLRPAFSEIAKELRAIAALVNIK